MKRRKRVDRGGASSEKTAMCQCSLHLLLTKMPSHTFPSSLRGLIHIHLPPLTLPATVDSSHTCAHTHSQQQRPLMSRNAHRSVKRHDSCRSGGSSHWSSVLCSPPPPPFQTMPGFSRHGRFNTVQRRARRKERSREEQRGRSVGGGLNTG